jgi:hypothetical protein
LVPLVLVWTDLVLLCTTAPATLAAVDFGRQLGETLRAARADAGLTHREMAKRLGASHATYTRTGTRT